MLLRNSLWNFAGSALPALVALATVPFLIQGLGLEGFGIVTLIASIVGYFGILDINLSAGAIKYLAQHHATNDRERFSETFWFGVMFYGALGLVGGVLLAAGSATVLARFFTVSAALQTQTLSALHWAAFGFALSQIQNYLLVVPQALQRYERSAGGEAVFGITSNILSALIAMAGGGIAGVIAGRVAVLSVNVVWLCFMLNHLGMPLTPRLPRRELCLSLMRFSGHSYLSRLASMLHQHADKLIIASVAGPVALAIYSVPAQLSGRILGLTYRLSSVIYPRVSALAASGQDRQMQQLYLDATRFMTYLNFAVLAIIALTGATFLRRWVGAEFVDSGYPVLLLVTLGLLMDSLTIIPSLVNDGLGHPRITGRFAIARGLLGAGMVYLGTHWAGIIGAAVAHLLCSVLMTSLFLLYVHGRTVPVTLAETWNACWRPSLLSGCCVLLLLFPLRWWMGDSLAALFVMAGISSMLLLAIGLIFIVHSSERSALLSSTRRLMSGAR